MSDPNCNNANVDLAHHPNSSNSHVDSVRTVVAASLALMLRSIMPGVGILSLFIGLNSQ